MPTKAKVIFYAKLAGIIAGLYLSGVGLYLGFLQLSGNFAIVEAAEVYRSAQPSAESIHRYASRDGIKSILNLRGQRIGASWYDDEVKASKELGIVHIDFAMSDKQELEAERVNQLIQIMESAPKPLLIHCRAGADRTGLASALYLVATGKQDEETAGKQLSIYYGHLSLPFIPQYAMDRTFDAAKPLLDPHNSDVTVR